MAASPTDVAPPPAIPEPGWTACWPFPEAGPNVSFVSAGSTGGRLRVAYFKRGADDALVGRAWFGPETEGPPGHVHGGAMAAVLDETLGAAAWAAGYPVVVASLKVDFRHLMPLGTDAIFETTIENVDGRKIRTSGRLLGRSGDVMAEGRALCVVLGDTHREKFEAIHRERLQAKPESAPGHDPRHAG